MERLKAIRWMCRVRKMLGPAIAWTELALGSRLAKHRSRAAITNNIASIFMTASVLFVMHGRLMADTTFTIDDCGNTIQTTPFSQTSTCRGISTDAFVGQTAMGSKVDIFDNLAAAGSGGVFTNLEDRLKIGGSPGESVLLTFDVAWSGTYSYSIPDGTTAEVAPEQFVAIGSFGVITDAASFTMCPPLITGARPCDITGNSGSGVVSYTATGTFLASVGDNLPFSWTFLNEVSLTAPVAASVSDDFFDPPTLTLQATDPNTGAPLTGITITGSDGFVYPVNTPSSVPEPGSLMLLTTAVAGGTLVRRRFNPKLPGPATAGGGTFTYQDRRSASRRTPRRR